MNLIEIECLLDRAEQLDLLSPLGEWLSYTDDELEVMNLDELERLAEELESNPF